jgi:hypothetical protein
MPARPRRVLPLATVLLGAALATSAAAPVWANGRDRAVVPGRVAAAVSSQTSEPGGTRGTATPGSPTPGSPTPGTGTPGSPSPTVAAPRDTAGVCLVTAQTARNGLTDFVARMQQVTTLSGRGDLQGADQAVRQAGQRLVAIGTQLRANASNAENANVKSAVMSLAAEFEALGNKLTGVASLPSFNTSKLNSLVARMGTVCPKPSTPPASTPATSPS